MPKKRQRATDPALLDAINRALATLEERNAAPYDGVSGQLPDWVPNDMTIAFCEARNRLLDVHPVADVRKWLRSFRESGGADAGLPPLWRRAAVTLPDGRALPAPRLSSGAAERRREILEDVMTLATVQEFVELGREKAVERHLGTTPLAVLKQGLEHEKQRSRASKQRSDGLQRVIIAIYKQKPNVTARQLLEELRQLAGTEVAGTVIEAVTQDEIEWRDAKKPAATTKISGLPDRLFRARKKSR